MAALDGTLTQILAELYNKDGEAGELRQALQQLHQGHQELQAAHAELEAAHAALQEQHELLRTGIGLPARED